MKQKSKCRLMAMGALALAFALSNAARCQPVAPAPDAAQTTPPSGDGSSDEGRDESANSSASTAAPNMIGDMGGGRTLQGKLQPPSHLGPVQSGQFVLLPSPAIPKFLPTGSLVFSTNATPLFGSILQPTDFIANITTTTDPSKPIPLTNSDSAYQNSATQALFKFYASQNTANQSLSTVSVSGTDAQATELKPHPNPIRPNDAFVVAQNYQYQYLITPSPIAINIPSPSGGVLGRQRISDNESPIPTDRVFCDYSFFHDAVLSTPSDANRFVPGFEKTFFDRRMSVEMRFPMGIMASSNIVADQTGFGTTGQFGDMEVILKGIVAQEETWTLSMGLGISIPTAPGVNVGLADGTPLLKIVNQSTHLLPFFGLLVKPNDEWFSQVYVQVDVAASGDPVSANVAGNGLVSVGDLYDQTLIFVDASIGRWLYRNPARRLSGLAAVIEAHYTGGVNAPSALQAGNFLIGDGTARYNDVDITVGAHAVIGNTTLTVGYATPATEDRGFDGELRVFVNRKF